MRLPIKTYKLAAIICFATLPFFIYFSTISGVGAAYAYLAGFLGGGAWMLLVATDPESRYKLVENPSPQPSAVTRAITRALNKLRPKKGVHVS